MNHIYYTKQALVNFSENEQSPPFSARLCQWAEIIFVEIKCREKYYLLGPNWSSVNLGDTDDIKSLKEILNIYISSEKEDEYQHAFKYRTTRQSPIVVQLNADRRAKEYAQLKHLIPPFKSGYAANIIMLAAGVFSSFSCMATPQHSLKPYGLWQYATFAGYLLFNTLGGMSFPGIPKSCGAFISGLAFTSGAAPGVLTYTGVTQVFGDKMWAEIFAILCAVSNVALSGSLGAAGVAQIIPTLKNFYRHYGIYVVREIELFIFGILAFVLAGARANAIKDAIPSEWNVSEIEGYGIGAFFNVAEFVLFLNAYMGLRMQFTKTIHSFCSTMRSSTSWSCPGVTFDNTAYFIGTLGAMFITIGFYLNFSEFGSQEAESMFKDKSKETKLLLETILKYTVGSAGALLVVGTTDTVYTFIKSAASNINSAAQWVWEKLPSWKRSEESQPLIGSATIDPTSILINNAHSIATYAPLSIQITVNEGKSRHERNYTILADASIVAKVTKTVRLDEIYA